MSASKQALDPALQDGSSTDIVIPIVGPTGAGKSYFINLLLKQIGDGREVKIGRQLTSCTSEFESVVIKERIASQDAHFLYLNNDYRIVLIDTPGFDDTLSSDYEILKQLSRWLSEASRRKMVLGGIIYLHDISQGQFSGTARSVLGMLRNLCGEAGFDRVVLVTTKWGREGTRNFTAREQELKDVYWKDILPPQDAASLMRLSHRPKNEAESAWRVVRHILRKLDGRLLKKALDEIIQKQDKRVKKRSTPAETEIARGLRIRMQTALAIQEEIVALEGQGVADDGTVREKEQKLWEMHQAISAAWKEKPSRAMRMMKSFLRPTEGSAVDEEWCEPSSSLQPGDVVLLVAGVAGSGRTTFINALLREVGVEEMEVADSGSLSACTTEVQCAMIDLSKSSICKRDYRLFVVDTPGFNDCDPKRSDSIVLQAILNWVHEWMQPNTSCRGGILYLQDISVYPLPPLASVNRTALSKNLDSDYFKQLAFATTKWKYAEGFGDKSHSAFEKQLGAIVSAGSKVYKFEEDQDAWSILQDFLPRIEQGREVALGGVLEAFKRGASQRPHLGGMDSFLNRFFGLLERLFV